MNKEKIKIRYHHLMCIPRFVGKGYSEDFCKNLRNVQKALKDNDYTLVDHCDNICMCCPSNINGKCANEELVKKYDDLVKDKLDKGQKLFPKDICSDCCWYNICKDMDVGI